MDTIPRIYDLYLYCSLYNCSLVEEGIINGMNGWWMKNHQTNSLVFIAFADLDMAIKKIKTANKERVENIA